MKKRWAALMLLAVVASIGGSAGAGQPNTGTYRCDTYHRRYYNSRANTYTYYDHNSPDSADVVVVPGVLTIHPGANENDAKKRFGVNTPDAWVEAIGGGGWGSNGYPYQPYTRTGEGGTVQGDVNTSSVANQDVANFSVSSFSLDDEGDGATWHDTYTSACVSAAGNSASIGNPPAQNGGSSTCRTNTATTKSDCWRAPTGNCDSTGTLCDQGIVLPTSKIPVHP